MKWETTGFAAVAGKTSLSVHREYDEWVWKVAFDMNSGAAQHRAGRAVSADDAKAACLAAFHELAGDLETRAWNAQMDLAAFSPTPPSDGVLKLFHDVRAAYKRGPRWTLNADSLKAIK